MNSLVHDLQNEILQSQCDILLILRKAHTLATKLELFEFDNWIMSELNGYNKSQNVPNYRYVNGTYRAKNPRSGWIPIAFNDNKLESDMCTMPVFESLPELIEIGKQCKSGYFHFSFPAEETLKLVQMTNMPNFMPIELFVSTMHISKIVENVKNALLEWTLTLQKQGILGEQMPFDEHETSSEPKISQQNNIYGNIITGNIYDSQIVSGNNNTMTFDAESIAALDEIRNSLVKEKINSDEKAEALNLLDEIKSKLEQNKKPKIIKSLLIGLMDFVMNAGANITATLIAAKIQGLF